MRRLRAILATSVLWALAWALTSVLFFLVVGLFVERAILSPDYFLIGGLAWTTWGALNGAGFAALLALAERRQTIDELSTSRVALWGALGGGALPLVTYAISLLQPAIALGAGITIQLRQGSGVVAPALLSGLLGAGAAVAQLSLARRLPAPRSMPSLPGESAT